MTAGHVSTKMRGTAGGGREWVMTAGVTTAGAE